MPYYGDVCNQDILQSEGLIPHMVNDQGRFDRFSNSMNHINMQDLVVCDLGAGIGLLGLEALRQGAKHVYLVEMVDATLEALQSIVAAHPKQDQITIIAKDICELTAEDFELPVDIFVSETFGAHFYTEGILHYFNHVLKIFPEARTIPERINTWMTVQPICLDNAEHWPQIGDPAIVEGYKTFYNGKRMLSQLNCDPRLIPDRLVYTWHKNNCMLKSEMLVDWSQLDDIWISLFHHAMFIDDPKIPDNGDQWPNHFWSMTSWFFKHIDSGSKLTFYLEDNLVPAMIVESPIQ